MTKQQAVQMFCTKDEKLVLCTDMEREVGIVMNM